MAIRDSMNDHWVNNINELLNGLLKFFEMILVLVLKAAKFSIMTIRSIYKKDDKKKKVEGERWEIKRTQ